jgi:hypothetical protein
MKGFLGRRMTGRVPWETGEEVMRCVVPFFFFVAAWLVAFFFFVRHVMCCQTGKPWLAECKNLCAPMKSWRADGEL